MDKKSKQALIARQQKEAKARRETTLPLHPDGKGANTARTLVMDPGVVKGPDFSSSADAPIDSDASVSHIDRSGTRGLRGIQHHAEPQTLRGTSPGTVFSKQVGVIPGVAKQVPKEEKTGFALLAQQSKKKKAVVK